jgi:site-specific recombinase XerD
VVTGSLSGQARQGADRIRILRHTFCSHLMQGAPMRGVKELVGHQSLAMTQRYRT